LKSEIKNRKPKPHSILIGKLFGKSITTSSLLKSLFDGQFERVFTGATTTHPGLFAECQDGTVFFDELAGLSLANQVQMLTYMDDVEGDGRLRIRKLGAAKSAAKSAER